jgi:hypothetical protein
MSFGTELSTAYQVILDNKLPPPGQQQPQPVQNRPLQQQNTPVSQIIQKQQMVVQPAIPQPRQTVTEGKQKKDILKTLLLSIIILLAIASHSLVEYIIKDLSASFMLSFKQEIGARLLYPLVVFMLLYFIKVGWV